MQCGARIARQFLSYTHGHMYSFHLRAAHVHMFITPSLVLVSNSAQASPVPPTAIHSLS